MADHSKTEHNLKTKQTLTILNPNGFGIRAPTVSFLTDMASECEKLLKWLLKLPNEQPNILQTLKNDVQSQFEYGTLECRKLKKKYVLEASF